MNERPLNASSSPIPRTQMVYCSADLLEILLVFFSFKIKFLTFNLLFKRKPKYACGPNMYVRLLAIFTGKGVKIFM